MLRQHSNGSTAARARKSICFYAAPLKHSTNISVIGSYTSSETIVQHCGAPISSLDVGRVDGERANPHIRQQVGFRLSRTQLLSDFEWGSRVRSDIENMDEKFDLGPLASEAMEQLRDIDRLLLDIGIKEAARTIGDVRELVSMLPSKFDGMPTLFRFSTTGVESTITSITPSHIQVEVVEMLERVADGTLEPSALHSAPQPSNPSFDPATVRERFRRDNRVVQIMSLWQAEGGGTADFEAEVNRMAQKIRVSSRCSLGC